MNKITVTGRFTKDVFLDESSSGVKFCKCSVASKRGKDQTDFFNCVAFYKRAETMAKYCHKGDLVSISGSMQSSRKENVTYWELLVEDIEFLGGKSNSDPDPASRMKQVDDDEDLPF